MTKEEFKTRWDSDELGGGITLEDIAQCAIDWNISSKPKTQPMDEIVRKVLVSAGVEILDN